MFDALSTSVAGTNEADNAVMSLVVENAKAIARSLDVAVLVSTTPARMGRVAHGDIAVCGGNIGAEWRIRRAKFVMSVELLITKRKDGESGQEFEFDATVMPLGVELTSLALAPKVVEDAGQERSAEHEATMEDAMMQSCSYGLMKPNPVMRTRLTP